MVHIFCCIFQALTVKQLKRLSTLITEHIKSSAEERDQVEQERNQHLREIGNLLHESVVVHNDEVGLVLFVTLLDIIFALEM